MDNIFNLCDAEGKTMENEIQLPAGIKDDSAAHRAIEMVEEAYAEMQLDDQVVHEGQSVDFIYEILIESYDAAQLEKFKRWADEDDHWKADDSCAEIKLPRGSDESRAEMYDILKAMWELDKTVYIHLLEEVITSWSEGDMSYYRGVRHMIAIIGSFELDGSGGDSDGEIYHCNDFDDSYYGCETCVKGGD